MKGKIKKKISYWNKVKKKKKRSQKVWFAVPELICQKQDVRL